MRKYPKNKKPYRSPKVESKEIYEIDALACGKCTTPTQISIGGGCTRGQTKKS